MSRLPQPRRKTASRSEGARQTPLPRRGRALKRAAIAVGTAICLAVLYSVYWGVMADRTRAAYLDWAANLRSEGYEVRFDSVGLAGFPRRIVLTVIRPAIRAPEDAISWGWETDRAVANIAPWRPGYMNIEAPGNQALVVRLPDRAPLAFRGTAGELVAELDFFRSGLASVSMRVAGLDLATANRRGSLTIEKGELEASRLFPEQPDHRTPAFDLRLNMTGVGLPDALAMPLGAHVESLEVLASVLGPVPGGPLRQSLAAWRDAGGTVELRRLGLVYEPLVVGAHGTLALDGELQPAGALTAVTHPPRRASSVATSTAANRSSRARSDRVKAASITSPKNTGYSKPSPVVSATSTLARPRRRR